MTWFIDKMEMHQEYPEGGLPVVGKHGVLRRDIATGEVVSDSVSSFKHEGSYSSSIQIRSTGHSVTIIGNPSRFNRSENLFGFTTIEECTQVYNHILASHGLPPFTRCTKVFHSQTPENERSRLVTDGATIRHLDWTRNHMVGQGREYAYLKALSGQTISRSLEPHLYPNGATVDWKNPRTSLKGKGSGYRYDKVYIKAKDLKSHRNQRLKNASAEEVIYYDRLIEYCQDNGIVREEQSKKSPFLKKHKLAYYGLCSEVDFLPHLMDIEMAQKRLEVIHMTYEQIAEQLIEQGICKSRQSANATEGYFLKWLHGVHIDKSKTQYFEHRNRLLQLGFDISIQHDGTIPRLQVRSSDVIDLRLATPPNWYRSAQVYQLRAVA